MSELSCKKVTEDFSVSEQILPEDLSHIVELGFKSIINNRPDNEEPNQPKAADIENVASAQGLSYAHVPIVMSMLADSDIESFKNTHQNLPKPILAFCRSGTRSISLWALAHAKDIEEEEIISLSDAAGYDLLPLVAKIRAIKHHD